MQAQRKYRNQLSGLVNTQTRFIDIYLLVPSAVQKDEDAQLYIADESGPVRRFLDNNNALRCASANEASIKEARHQTRFVDSISPPRYEERMVTIWVFSLSSQ